MERRRVDKEEEDARSKEEEERMAWRERERQARQLMRVDREVSVNYCLQFRISECGPGQ